ncbi:MAG: type II toxin-antitoxin system PemK/MazF family toxin [Candidatus Schekmanbacteria bacterium]|nr:type II toxin-antitoxin system PemK/MazF family toxin [Candidatus Schekmanbacteria bacterium]
MYHKGDIVLIPFPFTDLTTTKTRPAVVVSVKEFQKLTGDFTVAMITSVPHSTPYDYEIKDWQGANLISPSWIRAKLVTLDPQLVRFKPGKLTKADLTEAERIIQRALGLGL